MEKVLEKSVRLLEALAASQEPRGVTELSRQLGLMKSNVHRILSSLAELNLVRQDEGTRRYMLTPKLWQMGCCAMAQPAPNRAEMPCLPARSRIVA